MNIKGLRQTIRTYRDWELQEMREIIGNDELTKQHMITMELARRKRDDYVDKTLDPKVPIRKRGSL